MGDAIKTEGEVPAWLKEYVLSCWQLLGIPDTWHITVKMVDHPNNDPGMDGGCWRDSVYLNARFEFARDLENDERGKDVVFHEMWHVALADIAHVFDHAIKFAPESVREHLQELFNDAEEQFIQARTRAMLETIN